MNKTIVISLGGSIISPAGVDDQFLRAFYNLTREHLEASPQTRLILVCGGGAPAREYQRAYTAIAGSQHPEAADWIGIAATKLNAELLYRVFADFCRDPIVSDPSAPFEFQGRVLIASGWKPGFSTDYDAVMLAVRFSADTVVNLSNITKVYTDDPNKNSQVLPIDDISWNDFRKIVGDTWVPGKNTPFDPIASRLAQDSGLRVVIASGQDLANVALILKNKPFQGTLIH